MRAWVHACVRACICEFNCLFLCVSVHECKQPLLNSHNEPCWLGCLAYMIQDPGTCAACVTVASSPMARLKAAVGIPRLVVCDLKGVDVAEPGFCGLSGTELDGGGGARPCVINLVNCLRSLFDNGQCFRCSSGGLKGNSRFCSTWSSQFHVDGRSRLKAGGVCARLRACVCMHTKLYDAIGWTSCTCTHIHIHNVYMYMCICTCVYVHVYMYMCICTCVYVHVYMYIYTCTYTHVCPIAHHTQVLLLGDAMTAGTSLLA